jgi:hypothetical protein
MVLTVSTFSACAKAMLKLAKTNAATKIAIFIERSFF